MKNHSHSSWGALNNTRCIGPRTREQSSASWGMTLPWTTYINAGVFPSSSSGPSSGGCSCDALQDKSMLVGYSHLKVGAILTQVHYWAEERKRSI